MKKSRIAPLVAFCSLMFFASCSNEEPAMTLPLEVQYHINSPDPDVEKMVFTYFGDRVTYQIFSDSMFTVQRNAEVGLYQEWVHGDSLWIQEKGKTYAVSCLLDGVFLKEYLSSPLIESFIESEKREVIMGVNCKHGWGLTAENDSIEVYYAPNIPNAWMNQNVVPGMPLRYIYKVRGADVIYEADLVNTIDANFDRSMWGRNTIEQSPLAYLGLTDDTLGTYDLHRDVVNVKLLAYDQETDNLLPVNLSLLSEVQGSTEQGNMNLQEGMAEFLLHPGAKHTFMVNAIGYAPKKIVIDLSNQSAGLGQYDLEMDVGLFKTNNGIILEYLSDTPMGIAEFDTETESIVFDLEYTSAVNEELARLVELNK
ncbi:MAG: hypothetical protein P8N19_00520 [Flavobacteriales bacterium]|nr:hypothetical protein [Flavobacteriales bacterium]MDG1767149.1 hypothetical protein [Flavobacteriales bacterium]